MDVLALAAGVFISPIFCLGILLYILASRAYSFRGIRLKKFPITGYLTVIIFQGALTFFIVMHGSSQDQTMDVPLSAMIAASLLIGSFYPLSQVYQHEQDKADGVTTISLLLGYRGTFAFCSIVYAASVFMLWLFLSGKNDINGFLLTQCMLLPATLFFLWWFYRVWKKESAANFENTMKMNIVASICTNGAFILLLVNSKF
jgi:1,4-dihydroxy-2-naphthoate octaprenyltransferase